MCYSNFSITDEEDKEKVLKSFSFFNEETLLEKVRFLMNWVYFEGRTDLLLVIYQKCVEKM